jgi:hypothetical protein
MAMNDVSIRRVDGAGGVDATEPPHASQILWQQTLMTAREQGWTVSEATVVPMGGAGARLLALGVTALAATFEASRQSYFILNNLAHSHPDLATGPAGGGLPAVSDQDLALVNGRADGLRPVPVQDLALVAGRAGGLRAPSGKDLALVDGRVVGGGYPAALHPALVGGLVEGFRPTELTGPTVLQTGWGDGDRYEREARLHENEVRRSTLLAELPQIAAGSGVEPALLLGMSAAGWSEAVAAFGGRDTSASKIAEAFAHETAHNFLARLQLAQGGRPTDPDKLNALAWHLRNCLADLSVVGGENQQTTVRQELEGLLSDVRLAIDHKILSGRLRDVVASTWDYGRGRQ